VAERSRATAWVVALFISLCHVPAVCDGSVTHYVFGLDQAIRYDVCANDTLRLADINPGPSGSLTFTSPTASPVAIYPTGQQACGLAETNRSPFDLPEAEQELVGGFHTEYSGMRFALFFLAEYANMIVVAAMATTLFFGGWLRPFPNVEALWILDYVPGWLWFVLKTFGFIYLTMWIRATLPRYRYDQLMRLGWKVLIPVGIANLVVTAIVKVLL